MDPVDADVLIARPQAEIFAYLADVANHPAFMGHFTHGWHLTREDTYGLGAGVRFAFDQRRNRYPWVDATIIEMEPPRRLVLAGRTGKFNRVRSLIVWELEPGVGGATRVRVAYETLIDKRTDRFADRRGFQKARWRKTVRVLRDVLEGDREPGERATIAGGARKPASGYRFVAPGSQAAK